MNEILIFIIGLILIVDIACGLAFFVALYDKNFTILRGIKALLLSPIWFLFLDELLILLVLKEEVKNEQ